MAKLPKVKDVVHKHSGKIHKIKASLEALCFAAVAGGFHGIETAVSGSLALLIVCLVFIGDEA